MMATPITTTIAAARPAQRFKAWLLDYLVIALYILGLTAATLGLQAVARAMGRPLRWPAQPMLADLLAFATLILPVTLYFALQESSPRQATWGKRKAGLRVTAGDGARLSKRHSLVRSGLKFLPWQLAHSALFHIEGWPVAPTAPNPPVLVIFALVWVLVAAYAISLLVTSNHHTLYDRAAGARVLVANE